MYVRWIIDLELTSLQYGTRKTVTLLEENAPMPFPNMVLTPLGDRNGNFMVNTVFYTPGNTEFDPVIARCQSEFFHPDNEHLRQAMINGLIEKGWQLR